MRIPALEVRLFDHMIENVRGKVETSRTDFEVSLLRLLERVTNGTVIEISVTGALTLISNLMLWLNGVFVKAPRFYSNPGSSPEVQSPTNARYLAQSVISWSLSL